MQITKADIEKQINKVERINKGYCMSEYTRAEQIDLILENQKVILQILAQIIPKGANQ